MGAPRQARCVVHLELLSVACTTRLTNTCRGERQEEGPFAGAPAEHVCIKRFSGNVSVTFRNVSLPLERTRVHRLKVLLEVVALDSRIGSASIKAPRASLPRCPPGGRTIQDLRKT